MASKKLSEKRIEEVVKNICGEDVLLLVRKIYEKENVSEFQLAKQLKIDIKRVRNMLYRLYDNNLVEFVRKKDKKKGWYIYYWTFKPEQIQFIYLRTKKKQLETSRERLVQESSGQFFICPSKCVRMDFEQVVNFEYFCPECGQLMGLEDVSSRVNELKKKIIGLEKDLKIMGVKAHS